MAAPTPTLESLGAQIAELSKTLSAKLQEDGAPPPSFAADGPPNMPGKPDIQMLRIGLLEAVRDLEHLTLGPYPYFLEAPPHINNDLFSLDAMTQFDFFGAVPLNGSASYGEIAAHTKLPESFVRRILRYAMCNYMFAEQKVENGKDFRVVHTATSALLARDSDLRSWIGHNTEEASAAAGQSVRGLRKWHVGKSDPGDETQGHSGFQLSSIEGIPMEDKTFWNFIEESDDRGREKGWRAKRFAQAMTGGAKAFAPSYEFVIELYPWSSFPDKTTLVDVGGSAGEVARLIGQKHPQLNIIVQDLPGAEPAFKAANQAAPLKPGQLTFQAHDFFTPQTQPADAWMLKSILHDWPDPDSVRILQGILPVLRKGDKLLLFDGVLPPLHDDQGNDTVPKSVRKIMFTMDLQMHTLFNAKERNLEDWIALVRRASEKLVFQEFYTVPGQPFAMVEFVFEG
jgi:hypothetical protein